MHKTNTRMQDTILLSIPEMAAELKIGRSYAYHLARTGALPSVRLGRRLLVPRAQLKQYIAEHCGNGQDSPAEGA